MSDPETHIRPFGRYDLIRQIAVGGMGEIYLARTRSQLGTAFEGVSKRIVIKKILPALANEDEFVTKFIDEATIVTQLTHGNIVPVFDMGQEDGEYFIAMEFIPGRDLRDVVKRAQADAWTFPVRAVLFIIAEVCKGLSYAHRKKDEAGNDLNIIHRDISPSNVLVSTAGEIKIVDFGIAKAASKTSHSVTGRLQGKFSYMSPEQATGKHIDKRSDVFSTGVLFYELLTLQRPFDGHTDLETLDNIRSLNPPPPSTLRPGLSPAVDAMVMRALSKDPADRHQRVDQLEREAMQCLYAESDGCSGPELAELLLALFPDGLEREETRTAATGLTPVAGRRSVDDLMEAELYKLIGSPSSNSPNLHISSAFTATSTALPHSDTSTATASPPLSQPTPARRSDGKLETVSIVAPSLSETPLVSQHISDPRIIANDPPLELSPTADNIPAFVPSSNPNLPLAIAATADFPAVRAEDYPNPPHPSDITPTPTPTLDSPTDPPNPSTPQSTPTHQTTPDTTPTPPDTTPQDPPTASPNQPPKPTTSKTTLLIFTAVGVLLTIFGVWLYSIFFTPPTLIVVSDNEATRITLGDDLLGVGKKLKIKRLKPGSYTLQANRAGYETKTFSVELEPGEETVVSVRLQPKPTPVATISVPFSSDPAGARIYIDDQPTELVTKASETINVPIPSDGKEHNVTLKMFDPKTGQELAQANYRLAPGKIRDSYTHTFKDLLPKDPKPPQNDTNPTSNPSTTPSTPPEDTNPPDTSRKTTRVTVNVTPADAVITAAGAVQIRPRIWDIPAGKSVVFTAKKTGYKTSQKRVKSNRLGRQTISFNLEEEKKVETPPENPAKRVTLLVTATVPGVTPPPFMRYIVKGGKCKNTGSMFSCEIQAVPGKSYSVRAVVRDEPAMWGQRSCVAKDTHKKQLCTITVQYRGD